MDIKLAKLHQRNFSPITCPKRSITEDVDNSFHEHKDFEYWKYAA